MRHKILFLVFALSAASLSFAQTYSECNPLEKTNCPSDTALSANSYTRDFRSGADKSTWSETSEAITYTSAGAQFTISESGQAPTIESSWYIFFGAVSVVLKAAPGVGIVSSVVLESDDLDEIDWEWLGGANQEVESNYFGKGNTTAYDRAIYLPMDDTRDTFHNYTIHWTSDYILWIIDGSVVRTLNYADAVNGKNFPQTPMRLKIGTWAGGDSSNDAGTIGWAGGHTDYSQGPFTMTLESVSVVNYSPADSYSYSDTTGAWRSIAVSGGTVNSNEGGYASAPSSSSSGSSGSGTTTGTGMWWTASAAAVRASSAAPTISSGMSATKAVFVAFATALAFLLST
ncbi:concanavalin A-like lectin/glucanase domain-containing protein [Phyllosticta citriasiana]|uniref:concanavalin A-like lectin/glucanase domain-containing protein n=1 Tax=Phyllosticta citriasiana TaxID=595635 RepID=UPI0030FD8A53